MGVGMIRKVHVEDAEEITRILVESLGYTSTEAAVVRQRIAELADDERCLSLVWEDEATGQVAGLLHALRYDTLHSVGGWDVIALGVLPVWQGRGVGRQLLEACEDHVRQAGGRFIRLNSSLQRTEAHAFYEHLGYTSRKTQKHFSKSLA